MKDINVRGELSRFKEGISKGKVKIGFAGGSITTALTPSNWPTYVRGWLVDKFKEVRFSFYNAAIGATGSLCALALVDGELIDKGCDLVFVEYAVNDDGVDHEERERTREGLIRRLLASGIDVVIVYSFYQGMYKDVSTGIVPASIVDFERLAEHYSISSVDMASTAYDQVKRGVLPYNMWLPDGTHPQHLGSYIYASLVTQFFDEELAREDSVSIKKCGEMPTPLNKMHWQNISAIDFDEVKTNGSWFVEREVFVPWFGERLVSYAPGDSLSFEFFGRALAIVFNYGKASAKIEYSIDGGEWQEYNYQRVWWVPDANFSNAVKFADDLELSRHTFELRIDHGNSNGCTSSDCKIMKIFTVK